MEIYGIRYIFDECLAEERAKLCIVKKKNKTLSIQRERWAQTV